jgi:CheY-like chemotaxis protein/HPt (histidine-containing phosphotransfer) domain-containing protein
MSPADPVPGPPWQDVVDRLPVPCFILRPEGDGHVLSAFNQAAIAFPWGLPPPMAGQDASALFGGQPDILDCVARCRDQGGSFYHRREYHDPVGGTASELPIHFARLETGHILISLHGPDRAPAAPAAAAGTGDGYGLLAHIGQEMAAPLNALVGLGQLLGRTALNSAQKDYLDKMKRSSHSLLDTVNNLLDYAAIRSGDLELEIASVEPAEVVTVAWDTARQAAAAKGLAAELRLADDLPPLLHCDPRRLHQILAELLDNAVKFTPSGRISLEARRSARDRTILEFEVSDTGMGIAPPRLAALLLASVPFPDPDGQAGGPGLGLILVRGLAERHGGELLASSRPDAGTVFTLRLPEDARTSGALRAAPRIDGGEPRLVGLKILLVEDNDINRLVAMKTLKGLGLEVLGAPSGAEALEMLAAADFDLVFMDIQMPGMDGYETTRRLRLLPGKASLPVVALTAQSGGLDPERRRAAGMLLRLDKPASPENFSAAIREALGITRQALAGDTLSVDRAGEAALDDKREALARLGGNMALYQDLVKLFIEENRGIADQLRGLLGSGDAAGAAQRAHTIKGSAANLALGGIARIAASLEADLTVAAKRGTDTADLFGRVAVLDAALGQLEATSARFAAEASGPASPALDDDILRGRLRQVASLLAKRNFRAEAECQALRRFLEADLRLRAATTGLFVALSGLDFEKARRMVLSMLEAL